ncbi:MAG: type I 3-dehydroquinate dehydratase [Planctomycetes bacterium]|nr:type I 3-dehydroquinate dehydratase [Planctomycetota bacterium]
MALIVASLLAESREQVARAAAKAAMAGADWVELRLDRWPTGADLAPVISACRLPVLVACRTPDDGGSFRGTLNERRELFQRALVAGAQGLDLEGWETWAPPPRHRLKLAVRSFHSFTGVPKELAEIRDRLHQRPGTTAKIVVTAHDLADAAPVLELLAHTDQQVQPTAAFAMGRTAWPVRLLACTMGAPLVYGSVEPGSETAPGQVPVALLAGLYRARDLGPGTSVSGLLGNPALSSLGPWLHNRAFRRLGVDAVYLPFETSRPEAVLAMLPRHQLRGLSVTAPWKATMAAACQRLDRDAQATGVVNTLVAEPNGDLVGHNTDVAGVEAALQRAGVGAGEGRPAVVLGTGGAARAGAWALLRMGFAVTMLGRSLEPARAFAQQHGIRLGGLQARVIDEIGPAVVVHATPVGGIDRDPEQRLLPDYQPTAGTVVLDMVYQPQRTRLLRDADAAGAVAVSGVEMFLAQAAAQVQLLTGARIEVESLRAFLAGTAVAPPASLP